jgi:hypothetical protein
MKHLACLALALLLAPACGGDDDDEIDADLTLLDDASDEAFLTIRDLVDRGELTTDDDLAAHLTFPADGDALAAGTAPTFTWEHAGSTLRHGRTTGDFVWLSISCPGLAQPVDLVAIETEEWTVDADHWAAISGAGECSVAVVSAYLDREVVTDGPYAPSTTPRFTVTE